MWMVWSAFCNNLRACLLSCEEARRLETRLESLRAEANADLKEVIDLRREFQALHARANELTDQK
jgi:hypothetical protein